ncbi:hypothetical protein BLOT_004516 [Blomia tropicalis]|nr:hypothetical protein BLOT_004516 [Blomia tropicalis]
MYVEVLEKAALEKDQEIMRLKAQKFDEYISGSRVTQPLLRSGITKQRERSYAQAAMASAKTSDIKTNHVVILAPRNADMPTYSDTTFKLFKTSVNHEMLKDSKISIQNKKMSTKARVVLTCASQEQCEALCEAVSDDKWIKAVIPKKKIRKSKFWVLTKAFPKMMCSNLFWHKIKTWKNLHNANLKPTLRRWIASEQSLWLLSVRGLFVLSSEESDQSGQVF